MPTKTLGTSPARNSATGRPGLTKKPGTGGVLKRTTGRTLSVPTKKPGPPRVPRKPVVPKRRFIKRPPPLRTKPFVPTRGSAIAKPVATSAAKAASVGKLAVAKRIAGRLIGAYGVFSLVSDVFEFFAPGVQDWLQGGWKGADGIGREPVIIDGPAEIGSGDGKFRVNGSSTTAGGFQGVFTGTVWGPIGGYRLFPYSSGSFSCAKIQAFGHGQIQGARQASPVWTDLNGGDYAGCGGNRITSFSVGEVIFLGDGTATGGVGPPIESPNPVYSDASPASSPYSPPSTPSIPSFVPSLPDLAEIAETAIPDEVRRFLPSPLDTGSAPSENTTPTPSPGASPFTPTQPDYTSKQPRPTRPTTGSCSGASDSPCSGATFEMLEYLDDKLDRMEEEKEECPEPPALETCLFTYIRCTEEGPAVIPASFLYDPSSYSNLQDDLEELSNLALKGCEQVDSVVAIPDSWQRRKPAIVPTLVLVFRNESSRTYHSYSIPYPANTSPIDEAPLERFQKGNFMGSTVFDNGTRIIVNAETKSEALRVLDAFQGLIEPSVVSMGSSTRVSERRGDPVQVASMRCVRAMFFADGDQSLKPVWRRSYGPGI